VPELPDLTLYLEALEPRIGGRVLERIRIAGPSLLRSVEPPIREAEGKRVVALRRLGKRIVVGLEDEIFLVLHLMIAGRLRWKPVGAKPPPKRGLAALDFETGTLLVTEAGVKRRASLHLVRGEAALAEHDPGGLEVLETDLHAFQERLLRGNHTLKRALTDPRLFSGIGNAYSDEILHRARLSPVRLTQKLADDEITRLFEAVRQTLIEWTARLRRQTGDGFPEKVTAFRPEMAVHGRYREPCPDCDAPVQRIVYAEHETNYCAACQTRGCSRRTGRAPSRSSRREGAASPWRSPARWRSPSVTPVAAAGASATTRGEASSPRSSCWRCRCSRAARSAAWSSSWSISPS
jgi:formamidopyrimidine-DNA glycosylase